MRWLTFAVLVGLLLTVQSVFAARLELFGARPDWLLVFVVFVALYAPVRDALPAALLTGFAADLMSIERLGTIGLSYLLAAAVVVSLRDHVYRSHALTRFVVTLVASLLVHALWLVHRQVWYGPVDSWISAIFLDVSPASMYTAVWAPPFHALLARLNRTWGVAFAPPRAARGLSRV